MDILSKSQMTEEDIKLNFITPAIVGKGWQNKITMETAVKFTDGKINLKGNLAVRGSAKKADYLLYISANNPIAVVEAKDNNHSVSYGLQQAMTYAQMLDLPFAYSSNGDGFAEHDFLTGTEREFGMDEFPTEAELEDDGRITGIDDYEKNVNELLRVPFDFCVPSVSVENHTMEVTDQNGKPNHILLMHILPSSQVIANQADDVFLRIGDKSKKLNFEQRLQLVYAKGVKYFEDQPVSGASMADLDLSVVQQYCDRLGYSKGDAEHYLRHNHDFVSSSDGADKISAAAILLFGKDPQRFFPRARIRFVRYEGDTAGAGAQMNVVKDVKFTGRILDQLQDALAFVKTQIREYTRLGEGAVFQTIPEFPEFCWTELIVNAVAHRDYSIKGTDIQVKMFDDHFTVESPGILPGMVKISNIREFHFSRNPKIVELLNEYDLVKEFGEGVDRVFRDMALAGLPEPEYRQSDFMLYATLKNKNWGEDDKSWPVPAEGSAMDEVQQKILAFCAEPKSRKEIMEYVGLTNRDYFYNHYIVPLLNSEMLLRTIPDKPTSSKQKYVRKP